MNKYKCVNQKFLDNISECRRICKCGCRMLVPGYIKRGYVICKWCGGSVYFDPEKQKEHDKKCERENFRMAFTTYLKQQKVC